MAVVVIVGLIVAVVSLWWIASDQSRTIENYEKELTKKKPTVKVSRSKKNVSR